MHNEAVKAMRYPPEAPKSSVFAEDTKEETKEDMEVAKEDGGTDTKKD